MIPQQARVLALPGQKAQNCVMNTPPKQMERNPRIDLLRGWLMVLVITGHIVLGSVHENLIRYVIYAFHMPLFIVFRAI